MKHPFQQESENLCNATGKMSLWANEYGNEPVLLVMARKAFERGEHYDKFLERAMDFQKNDHQKDKEMNDISYDMVRIVAREEYGQV